MQTRLAQPATEWRLNILSIQERLGIATEPIEGSLWQWMCMLRSSIPGIVKSFDPIKQTCTVQIAIQETVLKPRPGAAGGTKPDVTENIPTVESIWPLEDVPISMMRVPGWSITLPIVPGTECLLVFSDMCIDGWWETGSVSPQYDRRRHDLSDAIAIFGPWSQPNKLLNYSTTSMQLRSDDGLTVIDISSTGIKIASPLAVSLVAPNVTIGSVGGVPLPLVNGNFLTWFLTVFMPSVRYVDVAPTPPVNPGTAVLKGM